MELQACLALPLVPHIRVEGLSTRQTVPQTLELVPCQILLYKQPEEGWDTAQGGYWEPAESI